MVGILSMTNASYHTASKEQHIINRKLNTKGGEGGGGTAGWGHINSSLSHILRNCSQPLIFNNYMQLR